MMKNDLKEKKRIISKFWFIWVLTGVTFSSMAIAFVVWCTNAFGDAILNALALKNGTQTYAWWERPPVRIIYKIRIFNYTNVADYENGIASKLHVEEVGPYVYRETLTRVNIKANNGTLSYQEKRSYQWESGSPDDELVTVPNLPLFTAVAMSRDISYFLQLGFNIALSTTQPEPFIRKPAGKFLWGYDDNLFDTVKPYLDLLDDVPFEKFGMLAAKPGVSKDRMTIHTGVDDLDRLGTIQMMNGVDSRHLWDDEECDKIGGTDGSMFPPKQFQNRNVLNVYSKDLCRKFPLEFRGYSSAHGIPTVRYSPPMDVFNSTRTKDFCFCPKTSGDSMSATRSCPPAGIFNASSCNFGVPILSSFPHFLYGDKSLLQQVDGLNPRPELHETYVDLHSRLGVPIGGWSRFQVNAEVRKAIGVPHLGSLKDGAVLPILWVEVGVDDMPEPVINILQHAYFTAGAVEATLQWGSLIAATSSFLGVLYLLNKNNPTQTYVTKEGFRTGLSDRMKHQDASSWRSSTLIGLESRGKL